MKLINQWKKVICGEINDIQLKEAVQKNYPALTSVVFTRECVLKCKHCVFIFWLVLEEILLFQQKQG